MLFRERRQILIFCLAGAMVTAFMLFRYLPLRKGLKALEQTRAAQTNTIAKASLQSRQLPALKEQVVELQRKLSNFDRQVPAERELGVFLQQLTNLMNKHNLTEHLIEPGKEVQTDVLNCIPVDLQCKGRLIQLFEFFRSLQGLDRLVRIEQVKLENDGDYSGKVSMRTNAVIYCRPQAG